MYHNSKSNCNDTPANITTFPMQQTISSIRCGNSQSQQTFITFQSQMTVNKLRCAYIWRPQYKNTTYAREFVSHFQKLWHGFYSSNLRPRQRARLQSTNDYKPRKITTWLLHSNVSSSSSSLQCNAQALSAPRQMVKIILTNHNKMSLQCQITTKVTTPNCCFCVFNWMLPNALEIDRYPQTRPWLTCTPEVIIVQSVVIYHQSKFLDKKLMFTRSSWHKYFSWDIYAPTLLLLVFSWFLQTTFYPCQKVGGRTSGPQLSHSCLEPAAKPIQNWEFSTSETISSPGHALRGSHATVPTALFYVVTLASGIAHDPEVRKRVRWDSARHTHHAWVPHMSNH